MCVKVMGTLFVVMMAMFVNMTGQWAQSDVLWIRCCAGERVRLNRLEEWSAERACVCIRLWAWELVCVCEAGWRDKNVMIIIICSCSAGLCCISLISNLLTTCSDSLVGIFSQVVFHVVF